MKKDIAPKWVLWITLFHRSYIMNNEELKQEVERLRKKRDFLEEKKALKNELMSVKTN